MSAYTTAVSGLLAQSTILAGHAQNIANAGVTGKPNPKAGERVAYQPVDPVTISVEAGVKAELIPVEQGSVLFYDPDSVDSDENGLVAYPNVSLEDEIVGALVAKNSYIANAKVISVQADMDRELLDILA